METKIGEEVKKNLGEGQDEQPIQIILPAKGKLISEFASEVANIMKEKRKLFYRINTRDIVEIGMIKLQKDGSEMYYGFRIVTPPRFITVCEQFFEPVTQKIDFGSNIFLLKKSMGSELANILLASEKLQHSLPQVIRIFTVPLPILYNNELTFPKKGYDARFSSWCPHDSPEINNEKMTLEEAKEIIEKIFKGFCFKTNEDKDMAIAALLTPFLRGLYPSFSTRTPVFFYEANRERAGKDYCAGIVGILYENYAIQDPPISTSENAKTNNTDELRKRILAALISGRKRIHFSNNKGFINNAVFEAVTTAETYSDRILGKSETITFDNELDFSLSGNTGVGYTADFANRCRFIKLFLDIEDANSRIFEISDLHKWVKEHRSDILSALWTLIRNWFEKGKVPGKVPFTSFPEWASICGGIMESAGYTNPCTADLDVSLIGGDNESSDMKALFALCYLKHPDEGIKKSEVARLVTEEGDIFGYLDLVNSKSNQTKFGLLLTKYIGREFGGIRLIVRDNSKRASRQEYIFTKEELKNIQQTKLKENESEVVTLVTLATFITLKTKNEKSILEGETLPTLPRLPPDTIITEDLVVETQKVQENPEETKNLSNFDVSKLPACVLQFMKSKDGFVETSLILESLSTLVSKDDLLACIEKLKLKGDVYEPVAGVLKLA